MTKVHPITAYRTLQDISLAEMAEKIGVSRQSLFRIERGEQTPSVGLIKKIVVVTNGSVSANELVRAA